MRGALLYRVAGRISLHTREQESFLPLESHYFLAIKKTVPAAHPTRHPCLVSLNSRLLAPWRLGALAGLGAPPPKVFGTYGRRFSFRIKQISIRFILPA